MTRYWLLAGGLVLLLLILFLAAEAARLPLLSDPAPLLGEATPWVAALGVWLLIADVLLPVPSSLLMTMHGALFGVALGTLLSTVGGVGAALFGFGLGRLGEPALDRLLRPAERARAARMLLRWGPLAILLSRPVPLLAEAVAILAGASPLRWHVAAVCALGGTLPAALLYAWIGAEATRTRHFVLAFLALIAVTAAFWYGARALRGYRVAEPDAASD
jgi:uncharacterized membrane protein YdjX (TVP38/TMEM64 family)